MHAYAGAVQRSGKESAPVPVRRRQVLPRDQAGETRGRDHLRQRLAVAATNRRPGS